METRSVFIALLMSISMVLLPCSVMAENATEEPKYRVYGSLYNDLGELAGSTSIKIDSYDSVWSEDGQYEIDGIAPGEHVIRAYFMNDGHTVVYRMIYVTGDKELNFYQDKNWITGTVHNQDGDIVSLRLEETDDSTSDSQFEFGPHPIGEYYTLSVDWERDSTITSQSLHLRIEEGSSAYPEANHFEIHHGMNNIFGFISDVQGNPVSEAVVSNGVEFAISNSDGFYQLKNLSVGSNQTLTIQQEGNDLLPSVQYTVTEEKNWVNLTTVTDVEFPRNVTFLTQTQTVLMSSFSLEWDGGGYTEYYSVYHGPVGEGNLIYRGPYEQFEYTPTGPGSHEFNIVAHNMNGSNDNSPSLLIIVLPNPSDGLIWQAGMSWDYFISHTPEYFHNRTYTMIGTETISDAFGVEQETFLVRIADDAYLENEKAFRWFDVTNLLPIKSYWVDDPASSSYYQEGTMGWDFTYEGESAAFFSDNIPDSLHFNRTNIIGVPGHPNGYDDTENTVSIQENVELTVLGQSYVTTYIAIMDSNDGVLSWEMWYNSSARNYVKIVDRLPGSHSDSVVYELSGYSIPTKPKFITESAITNDNAYKIEWAEFPTATTYQLIENGEIIYEGTQTSFALEDVSDGIYGYTLNAFTDLGYLIEGSQLEMEVDFIPHSPIINLIEGEYSTNDIVMISWSDVPNSVWYSLIVQDSDGEVLEMYNGSNNYTELSDLSVGQNRIRVNVMVQGKVSEYSSSEFVNIEEKLENEDDQLLSTTSFALTVTSILSSAVLVTLRRSRDV